MQESLQKAAEYSKDVDLGIRPKTFDEFIGQEKLKANLSVFIQSAKMRAKPLDHVLISGPPGLGKTTLSQIIGNELQAEYSSTSGPLLEKQGQLAAVLTNLKPMQVLFIDEIHRMNRQIEEILYIAMEDFKLDVIIGQGPAGRTLKLDLPPFTLIAATTRPGLLTGPLRDRFGIPLRLDYYDHKCLAEIVLRNALINEIEIEDGAAMKIAMSSRGTPRIANRFLSRCRDYALVSGEKTVTKAAVIATLNELNIDSFGLDSLDYKYLRVLQANHDGDPVGLATLAVALSEDKNTIEVACEPFLIRQGLIKKTSRGRVLTNAGQEYLSQNRTRIAI